MTDEKLDYQKNIFAHIFKVSNALQVVLDRGLSEDGLTAKQLFLMIVISSFGEASPTFKEAADKGGTSYQNVKQLALKLEKQGFVEILADPKDARARRLVMTEKASAYWSRRDSGDIASMTTLFSGFELGELKNFMDYLSRFEKGIESMRREE